MEQITLQASLRGVKGKQAVKKLRREGLVPGVVYHRGEESVLVSLPGKEISKIVHAAGGENALISLTVGGEEKAARKTRPRSVIIKEVQIDPVKRNILHVDFNEISLTEMITVEVEVAAVGEPAGVKLEGGVLDHPLRMLKIQCLPTDIPKEIPVDVSNLKLNDSIHVKDLALADTLKVLSDPEALLFQVKPHEEEKAEEALPGEAPEVEVMREKPEEEAKAAEQAEKTEAKPKAEKK